MAIPRSHVQTPTPGEASTMCRRALHAVGASMFALALAVTSAFAQAATGGSTAVPDLSGLWQAPYTPDLARAYGNELPFTPHGAQRWKSVDLSKDPTGLCLPVGPARAIQAPLPFQIVQTADVVTLLFEYQHTYRLIYLDGRKPPDDIYDYPEWMGFSTGRWENGTLVVETIAMHDRTWLDTAGHEHSAKLRLTERFRKVDDASIEWTVTIDDPVFYTAPWSVTRPLRRLAKGDRIMSYSCEENNKDIPHLVPTVRGQN